VLVVAGQRQHEVGWAPDPCALEHEQLGRVALVNLMLELPLEHLVPVPALLDQGQLVAEADERPRHVGPHLAAACNDRVHQAPIFSLSAVASTELVSTSMAAIVGQTVGSPRSA